MKWKQYFCEKKRFLYEKERIYIDLEKPADTNNKKELCEEVEVNLEWKIVTPVFSFYNWEIPGSAACFCCRRAVFQSGGWRSRRSRDSPAPEAAPGSTCGSNIALTHWKEPSRNMSTIYIFSWDGKQFAWEEKVGGIPANIIKYIIEKNIVEDEYRQIEDGKSHQTNAVLSQPLLLPNNRYQMQNAKIQKYKVHLSYEEMGGNGEAGNCRCSYGDIPEIAMLTVLGGNISYRVFFFNWYPP